MLRVGLIDRFPLIFIDNITQTVKGPLLEYVGERISIIGRGLNLTWSVAGHNNRGCIEGVCHHVARSIQLNRNDICSESTQLFLFDSIYPNITISPPIMELDCAFLSYLVTPPKRRFSDILTTLRVFTASTMIFLITLLTLAFILRNFSIWSPIFYRRFSEKISDRSAKAPTFSSQFLPKLAGCILTLALLQFQTFYSASFQTNLVSIKQMEPVISISDLVSRNLRAYVSTTSNCYRGLLNGKNYHIDQRVHDSLIINRNSDLTLLASHTISKFPLAVFFGNSIELNIIRKAFSGHPNLYSPTIVKVKSSTIQDIYMYSTLISPSLSDLLISRFHSVLENDLFWNKQNAIYADESRAYNEYQKRHLSVGFRTLEVENYQYVTGIYLTIITSPLIVFFIFRMINKLIQFFSKFSKEKTSITITETNESIINIHSASSEKRPYLNLIMIKNHSDNNNHLLISNVKN